MGTQTLRRFLVAGLTAGLLAVGCASMKPAQTPKPDAAPAQEPAAAPATTPSAQAQVQAPPPVSAPTSTPATVSTPSTARAPPPAAAPTESPAKTKSQPPSSPNKPASAAAAKPQQPVAAPVAATLDLASLEQRLKDTRAIGVFTKLSLKNQVDDLLGDFRAFYKAAHVSPSPELRQRYDLLLLKVLSLLQDGDPPLAAAIWSSKEAIWSILADPDKLAKI